MFKHVFRRLKQIHTPASYATSIRRPINVRFILRFLFCPNNKQRFVIMAKRSGTGTRVKSSKTLRSGNGEILWRLCKALYKMSSDQNLSQEVRCEIINEAHNLITIAYMNQEDHPEINKWMAIILSAKCDMEGLTYKVHNLVKLKEHLMKSYTINPTDYSVLYMLGHWCYSVASLSWFQASIAYILYGPLPHSTYEEAYEYFSKAEELKPRSYIPNTFMLGKVSLYLNKNFNARYYLNLASKLTPRNYVELQYQINAQNLLIELDYFDLCKYSIFTDFLDI